MAKMSEAEIAQFLVETRVGTLAYKGPRGAPRAVPIWFDWDGIVIRMFTFETAPKYKYLQKDPQASLVVAAHITAQERERWVAFDGEVHISEKGGIELVEKILPRYWTEMDDRRRAILQSFRDNASLIRLLELTPSAVRSYLEL